MTRSIKARHDLGAGWAAARRPGPRPGREPGPPLAGRGPVLRWLAGSRSVAGRFALLAGSRPLASRRGVLART